MKKVMLISFLAGLSMLLTTPSFASDNNSTCIGNTLVDQRAPILVSISYSSGNSNPFLKALKKKEGLVIVNVLELDNLGLKVVLVKPEWTEIAFPPVLGFDQNNAMEDYLRKTVNDLAAHHGIEVFMSCNWIVDPTMPSVGGTN